MNQPRETKNKTLPLIRDIVATAFVGILLLIIHEFGEPFIRGFNCDDDTIRYPHKDSTVSSNVCYFVGSGINIFLILIFEYLNVISETRTESTTSSFDTKLYLRNVYCRLLVWFFGAISSELLTDIAKVTAGRLRPHFIDVCKPVIRDETTERSFDEYCREESHRYQYVTNYYCSGSSKNMRDIRLSFLSGHSSYSSYSAAFAVFYLQSRMEVAKFGLVKPGSQVLLVAAAFYTALTRVSDYKHHWQDVLAGILLGTLVATTVSRCLWPALSKIYAGYFKQNSANTRVADEQLGGEELNRVSY